MYVLEELFWYTVSAVFWVRFIASFVKALL